MLPVLRFHKGKRRNANADDALAVTRAFSRKWTARPRWPEAFILREVQPGSLAARVRRHASAPRSCWCGHGRRGSPRSHRTESRLAGLRRVASRLQHRAVGSNSSSADCVARMPSLAFRCAFSSVASMTRVSSNGVSPAGSRCTRTSRSALNVRRLRFRRRRLLLRGKRSVVQGAHARSECDFESCITPPVQCRGWRWP